VIKLIRHNLVNLETGPRAIGTLLDEFAPRVLGLSSGAGPIAFAGGNVCELIQAAAWLAETNHDGLVLPQERLTTEIHQILLESGSRVVNLTDGQVTAPPKPAAMQAGRISLLTSGTTGTPKLIEHSWSTLFTMAKVRNLRPLNWLSTYQGGTYAWFQILTTIFFVEHQTLTVAADRDPAVQIEAALRHGVTALSATPTFWRFVLIQFAPATLQQLPLQQITLGGERIDQEILDRLKGLFPEATLTHIYASTEAGACVIVRDGKEGFPIAWLHDQVQDASERPQLQIRDGLLWILSPHSALNRPGWINTGDSVEIRGDRVFILGRLEQSIINVGGMKFAARDVEQELLRHPSVVWCRVSGRRAPLVGEVVACDAVLKPGAPPVTESDLMQYCAQRIPSHMVPRFWQFLREIPMTDNLKTTVR